MPELAEVETARRAVHEAVLDKKIVRVTAAEQGGRTRDGQFDEIVVQHQTQQQFESAFVGRVLTGTGRCGKQMWWLFDDPALCLGVHFGMTGALSLKTRARPAPYASARAPPPSESGSAWPPPHTKCVFEFADGEQVAFSDARRLGRLVRCCSPHELVGEHAPDALNDLPSEQDAEFHARVVGSKVAIKTALLDQRKIVAGVGNWMADDILLLAGIHPETKSSSLVPGQTQVLKRAIATVAETACAAGARNELLPKEWLIHIRWDAAPAAAASGPRAALCTQGAHPKPVSVLRVGGRTTLFVPALQRKTLAAATLAVVAAPLAAAAAAAKKPRLR